MDEELDLRSLVEKLRDKKDEKTAHEEAVKTINVEIEELEVLISDLMFQSGQTKATFTGIGTVSPTIGKYPRIVNKDSFFDYLRQTNQEAMIQETVNANTLRSWFNQKAFSEEESEGIGLDYYEKVKISLRSN